MTFNRKDYQNDKGEMMAYCWPGGYPLFYVTADNGILCPNCASSCESKQATPDDKQWWIVAADVNYEDGSLYCDHCNERIEAAYVD